MGLAGPDFNGRLISAYSKMLKYFDIVEYARQMCSVLLGLGCELIIALTHARMPADTELAKKVPQIDFILGGHDHSSVFQVFNETPIIKSDSNFECLSILKIFKGEGGKDVRLGRRWRYTHECKKVKKALREYPEIESYVKEAMEAYKTYEK
jgi:2',3'-cyclic-nucleotide 2'-phosphodiesterase (5'-nucleotidase family)